MCIDLKKLLNCLQLFAELVLQYQEIYLYAVAEDNNILDTVIRLCSVSCKSNSSVSDLKLYLGSESNDEGTHWTMLLCIRQMYWPSIDFQTF